MRALRNRDDRRLEVIVDILSNILKSEWYTNLFFKIARDYREDRRYLVSMKVRSHTKAFTNTWSHIGPFGLVYNADSHIHDNYLVQSYEDLPLVRYLGQMFSALIGLDKRRSVNGPSTAHQLVSDHIW